MKTKTNELTGAALDWAVAKCEGVTEGKDSAWYYDRRNAYNYSTDWAQGGPIIERENIELKPTYAGWTAFLGHTLFANASTPLIAAMRCYVASKLGNDIDIPEGLK